MKVRSFLCAISCEFLGVPYISMILWIYLQILAATMILPFFFSFGMIIEDGMDETLCPVDYAKAGVIVDDDVHDVLVRGLPKVCSQWI